MADSTETTQATTPPAPALVPAVAPAPVETTPPAATAPAGAPAGTTAAPDESPGEAPADSAPATPVVPPPKEDWRDARIKRLTAKLRELQPGAKPDESEPSPPSPDPGTRLAEAEIERRAQELSRQNSAIAEFNRQCNDAAAAGQKTYKDFDSRITSLRQLAGGPEDLTQQVAYNQFVAAALETGEAPKLLHVLGGDLDEAARIMALNPVRMAIELTRLAARDLDTNTSQAPKPISPVGGRGAPHTSIDPADPERADRLTTAEWMTRRNAQVAAQEDARSGRTARR